MSFFYRNVADHNKQKSAILLNHVIELFDQSKEAINYRIKSYFL
jgi:hypothetical protein